MGEYDIYVVKEEKVKHLKENGRMISSRFEDGKCIQLENRTESYEESFIRLQKIPNQI